MRSLLNTVEAFLAEELEYREKSFLTASGSAAPAEGDDYIDSAREALKACRDLGAELRLRHII